MNPKNIIVRMPNWLGDFVMAIPVLHDLRKKFESANITVMCIDSFSNLLEKDKHIDTIFSFKKNKNCFSKKNKKIIEKIKLNNFDLGILLTNSFSSAWFFLKGNVKKRIGYIAHCRSFLLNQGIAFSKERTQTHLVNTYKDILKPLNIQRSNTTPKLFLEKKEIKKAKELLYENGYIEGKKLIGINALAAYGSAKCWPLSRYKKLVEMLIKDKDLYVVFFGDKKAALSKKDNLSKIEDEFSSNVINLAGKTSIRQFICLINECDLFLTNDSGPMHVAAALDTQLIALFGSTCQIVTGPYKKGIIINKKVNCAPCFKRECPKDFSCMKNIKVEEVLFQIKKILHV